MNNATWELIRSDADRWKERGECLGIVGGRGMGRTNLIVNALLVKNQSIAYLFWLRILGAKPKGLLRFIAKWKFRKISRLFSLQISPHAKIGKGLYIYHGIGIVVSGQASLGDNCSISQFTTIGSHNDKAAQIGNNVYIGPGCCLVGGVKIGNNVKVGAGTVVVHDVPDNATTVGNPNRIIQKNE